MSFHWSPIATEYDPLKAGSIDGTDEDAHDHGIIRAINSKYRPNKGVIGLPERTVFVSRLHPATTEDTVSHVFSRFGPIKRVRVVTDIITGFSKGYGFIEFENQRDADKACRDGLHLTIDGQEVFVDYEQERTLKGWVPRRLGGGYGGKKESGQLRFGGKDRPFRKPLILETNVTRGRSERHTDTSRPNFENYEPSNRWNKRPKDHFSQSPDRRGYGKKRGRSRSRSPVRSYKYGQSQRSPGRLSKRRSRSRSRERDRYTRHSKSGRY